MPPPRPPLPLQGGGAPERRFLLSPSPDGIPRRLAPEEVHHARNVLRLGPGDDVLGLDGAGAIHPVRVVSVTRGEVRVEPAGEVVRVPAAGEPGAPLPRIVVATALPRGARAEAMVDRLTQLGAHRIVPLTCARTASATRDWSENRRERLRRACREACKQAVRAWFPEVGEPAELGEVLAEAGVGACVLEPRAEGLLREWIDARNSGESRAWTLIVGPEGGFTDAEREAARASGAGEGRLGPHVLRVETAAEAGLAVLVQGVMP